MITEFVKHFVRVCNLKERGSVFSISIVGDTNVTNVVNPATIQYSLALECVPYYHMHMIMSFALCHF